MYLKTLPINRFNTITVCSLTPEKLATKPSKGISKTKRHKNTRNTSGKRRAAKERELNETFLKNLATHQLSDDQVNVLSRVSNLSQRP